MTSSQEADKKRRAHELPVFAGVVKRVISWYNNRKAAIVPNWQNAGFARGAAGDMGGISAMDLTEYKVDSKTIFQGRIVKVTVDQARLPDGNLATREVVCHPGGVAILPLDEDNNVTLVRQYRYPIGRELLELPAGKLDHGAEDHLPGAKRELSEETGLEGEDFTYLGYILASPGFCDEALHMYLARGLTRKERHPDEDEFLDVVTMPFHQLVEQVMDGTITDAKTVATTLKVKVLLGL